MRTISGVSVGNKAPSRKPAEEALVDPASGADGIDEGKRLVRVGGDRGISLAEKIAAQFRLIAWRSPLHRLRLRGRFPLKLITVPTDPIMGDAAVGSAMMAGQFVHRGESLAIRSLSFAHAEASDEMRDWLQGFSWLRDLSSASERAPAAQLAEPLTRLWLAEHAEFDPIGWRPDLIGTRLIFWTAYAPLILSSADLVYRSAVLNAIARMARHLERSAGKADEGLRRIAAFGGLTVAGLMIPGGEPRQARGQAGLEKALDGFLYEDGGVASRSPVEALELLELMLTIRAFYSSRRLLPPAWFDPAIDRLVPALKGAMLGDSALSAWHGGSPADPQRIERAIIASGVLARPLKQGGEWGFQRLAGGKTVVVCDVGPPPPARLSQSGHASTLAFELSDGAQRIVVNCGGERGAAQRLPDDLASLLKTTAAHSTLVVEDVNSTSIRSDGMLGKGVSEVLVHRQENEAGTWVDAGHDGYVRRFGLEHRRRFYLSANGQDLRGEDTLLPAQRRGLRRRVDHVRFDIRFHLAPGVEPVPTADGQAALIKLPDGRVWQFRCRGGKLAFDDSLWIDGQGAIKATRQMVISGDVAPGGGSVAWSFRRAG